MKKEFINNVDEYNICISLKMKNNKINYIEYRKHIENCLEELYLKHHLMKEKFENENRKRGLIKKKN